MTMSRREFLSPLIRTAEFVDRFRSGRNHNYPAQQPTEAVIESGCEIAVIAAAVHTAIEGGKDKIYAVDATPTEAVSSNHGTNERYIGIVEYGSQQTHELSESLGNLEDFWNDAYYKSRTESYVYLDADSGEVKLGTRTVYDWEEPDELTARGVNHGSIGYWNRTIQNLDSLFSKLKKVLPDAPVLEVQRDPYQFTPVAIDQGTRNMVTTLGFGVSTGLFAFYEEIAAKSGLSELSSKGIKRRSLMKLGAGLFLASKVQGLQQSIASNNSGLLNNVEQYTKSVVAELALDNPQIFERYFGDSVDSIMADLEDMINKTSASLEYGNKSIEAWDKIKPILADVQKRAIDLKLRYSDLFKYRGTGKYEISDDLTSALKSVLVHQKVMNYISDKNREVSGSAVGEVLLFAAGLAGISVANEALIVATDSAIDRLLEQK